MRDSKDFPGLGNFPPPNFQSLELAAIVTNMAAQLHLGGTFESSWIHVAKPWFERAAKNSWRGKKPWAVLAPSRAFIALLKQRALAENISLAAVRFCTPGDIREFLVTQQRNAPHIAVREHLHLLLALIAAQSGETPTVRAIARDPARLMRTLDALASVGEGLSLDLPPEAKNIAENFNARLKEIGWQTVQHVDWHLAETPPKNSIASLLVIGFDGMHWETWPLLCAAVRAAENADIVLNQPRYKAENIDQIWIGSWEQNFGASHLLADESGDRPFAPLSEKMENPQGGSGDCETKADVLFGHNVREQADSVVARCVTWLASGDVESFGILVPGPGALSREISAQLIERGIVHYDAIGHGTTPDAETENWQAWLELQREQKLGPLLEFVGGALCPAPTNETFFSSVESAFGEVLVGDLDIIAAWLRENRKDDHKKAAAELDRFIRLPTTATLVEFLKITTDVLRDFGWRETLARLNEQSAAVSAIAGEKLSRSLFLDWLASVTTLDSRTRDMRCANPYAIVQLLPYGQAEGRPWSHLLFAGLNEGQWPPAFEQPGFLNENDVSALNRQNVTTGNQGEGHLTVRDGRALLLGPNERRALARRQFYNLVESPAIALAATAALENDEDARSLGPGDFLSHLYFTQTGEPLTESRAAQIHAATQRWLGAKSEAGILPAAAEQTRVAFAARRVEKASFGEYEFALIKPPPVPLIIACKEWETAVKNPAVIFLTHFLGVEAKSDFLADDRWPLTTGTWVHAWLSSGIASKHPEKLVQRPTASAMTSGTRNAAGKTRTAAERAFSAAHRTLPDWWQSRWSTALWMSGELAERVGEIADWPWAATEWKLPKPTEIKIGDAILRVRGRIDLVLSHEEIFAAASRLWLFDFKTGSDKPLKPKDLIKKFAKGGGGLQLALYALALRALGASDVAITLLTPETEAAPQLTSTDVESLSDFWRGLARMQDTGIFGMRGELRSEFSHAAQMPIATLSVATDLLEEKWALSHPLLTVAE